MNKYKIIRRVIFIIRLLKYYSNNFFFPPEVNSQPKGTKPLWIEKIIIKEDIGHIGMEGANFDPIAKLEIHKTNKKLKKGKRKINVGIQLIQPLNKLKFKKIKFFK